MPPIAADAVTIRTSRRARKVRLRVLPPGRVEVVLPPRVAHSRVPEVLEQHAEWLRATLARVRQAYAGHHSAGTPPTEVVLAALGRRYTVEALAGEGSRGRCVVAPPDRLQLHYAGGEHWQPPLRAWLVRTAGEHLVPQLERLARDLGLRFTRAAVRGQKTRWGSCSARGTISLNYCLLFLDPALVRYVLLHELCHLVHLDHSREFWALVERCEPGYRLLEARLRRAGPLVPLWARG